MNKGTHFIGQPVYGQLLNLLDKEKIMEISRENGGERYVKKFDVWQHLAIMLYAVIKRYDSIREITGGMLPEVYKLNHLGVSLLPKRSTFSDANARRPECIFEAIYRDLYERYKQELSSDSRHRRRTEKWMDCLQILDSTTITLFSNLIFKGVGRYPKQGKKKGGIKVHSVIQANEGVPCDVRFTSAATNDSFMLVPSHFRRGDIVAMDRAYVNYCKFEELTGLGVTYVTKMKKNLVYDTVSDVMYMDRDGLMECIQHVTFTKHVADGEDIVHHARIITHVDMRRSKPRQVSLLTNDMDLEVEDIVDIYRKRWQIELLFKQLKQNFPLRYFYGESANVIKIQIWVTLIANLLLMVLQRRIKRPWSFSGLATMVRNMLMYYINVYTFFEEPEKDWLKMQQELEIQPREPTLFPELFD